MTRHDRARRCAALASALTIASALAIPRPARAQAAGERAAAAQALFDEAMRLMKAEQNAEACPKLEESQRLDPGMGTEFRLAECYEKVGKLASAWAKYVSVADSAALARMPERETVARQRAQALVPRLSKLSISVPRDVAATPGLEVQRDGVDVGQALWEVAVPVDPGEHVVTARAPGKRGWEGRVTVTTAAAAVFSVAVQPLADLPQGPLPAPPPVPAARRSRSAAPAFVLGGLAVAGVGAGVGLFVAHSSAASDAQSLSAQIKADKSACGQRPDPRCAALADKASSADTLGNASTGAFVAGGALAVAAVAYVLWPASSPTTGEAHPVRLHPVVGQGFGALFVDGSF